MSGQVRPGLISLTSQFLTYNMSLFPPTPLFVALLLSLFLSHSWGASVRNEKSFWRSAKELASDSTTADSLAQTGMMRDELRPGEEVMNQVVEDQEVTSPPPPAEQVVTVVTSTDFPPGLEAKPTILHEIQLNQLHENQTAKNDGSRENIQSPTTASPAPVPNTTWSSGEDSSSANLEGGVIVPDTSVNVTGEDGMRQNETTAAELTATTEASQASTMSNDPLTGETSSVSAESTSSEPSSVSGSVETERATSVSFEPSTPPTPTTESSPEMSSPQGDESGSSNRSVIIHFTTTESTAVEGQAETTSQSSLASVGADETSSIIAQTPTSNATSSIPSSQPSNEPPIASTATPTSSQELHSDEISSPSPQSTTASEATSTASSAATSPITGEPNEASKAEQTSEATTAHQEISKTPPPSSPPLESTTETTLTTDTHAETNSTTAVPEIDTSTTTEIQRQETIQNRNDPEVSAASTEISHFSPDTTTSNPSSLTPEIERETTTVTTEVQTSASSTVSVVTQVSEQVSGNETTTTPPTSSPPTASARDETETPSDAPSTPPSTVVAQETVSPTETALNITTPNSSLPTTLASPNTSTELADHETRPENATSFTTTSNPIAPNMSTSEPEATTPSLHTLPPSPVGNVSTSIQPELASKETTLEEAVSKDTSTTQTTSLLPETTTPSSSSTSLNETTTGEVSTTQTTSTAPQQNQSSAISPETTTRRRPVLFLGSQYEDALLLNGTTPGCLYEDREKFKRQIIGAALSRTHKPHPLMLSFSRGTTCVGVSTIDGVRSIQGFYTLFPQFPKDAHLSLDGAGSLDGNVILLASNSQGQTVWTFSYNATTEEYMKESVLTSQQFLSQHCGIAESERTPQRIQSFTQAAWNDSSCIVFGRSEVPVLSVNASREAVALSDSISYLLRKEFVLYPEAIFSWMEEGAPASFFVYGSNGELYRVWVPQGYQRIPYTQFPSTQPQATNATSPRSNL